MKRRRLRRWLGWTDDEDLEQLRMMMMGWDAPVYMDNFEINMILMGTWIGPEEGVDVRKRKNT